MAKHKDYLNSDHVPTLDELKELFHNGNDFTTMSVMDIDYDKLPADTVEKLEQIKRLMREPWNDAAKARGLGDAGNYGEDDPLRKLQGSMEDLVSGAVYQLMTEHPENVAVILSAFDFSDPDQAKPIQD